MQTERDSSVDITKGIGIILVVFGHTIAAWGGEQEVLHRFIYSFHMPLFFGLSGIYISSRSSMSSFIKSKLVRFVVPFLFWVALYFFLYLALRFTKSLLQDVVNVNDVVTVLDLQIVNNLFAVPILANWSAIKDAGIFIDLWFLPAVISIVVLYKFICFSFENKKAYIILPITIFFSYAVVFLNNKYNFHSNIPWSIDIAIVCLPFLVIAKYRIYVVNMNWVAIPFLIFIVYYLSKDMAVEIAGLKIENYPIFFITAICGMTLVFLVAINLQQTQIGSILSALGKRTYLIFVLQGVIFIIFKPLLSRLPVVGDNLMLFNVALFFATLIVGYALYPLFNKYDCLRFLSLGSK